MKVVITGGAGFVGCNLANLMISQDHEVIVLDNLLRPNTEKNIAWLKEKYGNKFTFYKEDIRNYDFLQDIITPDIDAICHLAAQVAVTSSVQDPRRDFEANALGSLNVLEAARRLSHPPIILFSSTNKVYGEMPSIKTCLRNGRYEYKADFAGISEDFPLDFHSPYGCSKGAADQYFHDYYRIYGIPTVVFRMSCIYGPHQFGNEDQGWIAHFLISAVHNKPITIYGDGKQVRDILHVTDLCALFLAALNSPATAKGKIYNAGGGKENTISLLELLEFLSQKLARRIKYSFSEWRPGDQKIYCSDNTRATKELNWKPRIGKYEGIESLLEWVQDHPELFP